MLVRITVSTARRLDMCYSLCCFFYTIASSDLHEIPCPLMSFIKPYNTYTLQNTREEHISSIKTCDRPYTPIFSIKNLACSHGRLIANQIKWTNKTDRTMQGYVIVC